MKTETMDTMIGVGNKALGTGASMGAYAYFSSSEFIGLAGVVIALFGVFVNMYFKWRSDVRAQHVHLLQTEILRKKNLLNSSSDFVPLKEPDQ